MLRDTRHWPSARTFQTGVQGALPLWPCANTSSISRDANRCRSGLHRPGCGGSTPPSRRVPCGRPPGSQALQRCSGLLNRRARGSTVATHHFAGACARPQQFARGALAARKCSASISKEESGLKNVRRRSGVVRTPRERLLSAIFLRPFCSRGTIISAPVAVCQHLRTRRLQVIPPLRDCREYQLRACG